MWVGRVGVWGVVGVKVGVCELWVERVGVWR